MLNLKKVIALVCVFAMALSTVAFGATYSDVDESSAYYEAVETLNKLEIVTGYEDGTFKPEDGVTRAEMAALIARIQGYGETAKGSANTGFADVPASHWASGYIANAAGMGIINGYGDGNFGPEDPVLYEQAVKMIMATLGYTPFAEKNGGYPTGYLAAAQRYDVSLAVANAAVGQAANRGTVAQLLENALDTPLMIQASWNTNGEVTYVIADGKVSGGVRADYKTLMSENLGYVKVRGIVTDNGIITINTAGAKTFDTTETPAVAIDVVDAFQTDNVDFQKLGTKKFFTGATDAADYLGQSVIAYVKKLATDDYELISIAVDTNRNDVLTINLDQYASAAGSKVKYYKTGDNDTTDIDCQAGMAVIFNNQCIANGIDANGDPDASGVTAIAGALTAPVLYGGTITFIDNNDKAGYDVAIIEAAATAVVKKVSEDGITFKKGITLAYNNEAMGMIEIDADDETKVVAILKDGEAIDAAELNEWDVLSVIAVKENANVIVAEVVTNQVVGTVNSKKNSKTSATGTAYNVDGTWYDVAKSAYKATTADIEVGLGGTFYIDKYGKIAAFNEDTALAGGAVANYGYVLTVAGKEADFAADGYSAKVQLVTTDGIQVLEFKKNAKVKLTASNTVVVDPTTWNSSNVSAKIAEINIIGQVVKYAKNSNNEITEITAATFDTEKFRALANTVGSYEFDADNSRFLGGAGYVDTDAMVFLIGGLNAGPTASSKKDSKVGTLVDLDHENSYKIMAKYADAKADDCNILVIDLDSLTNSPTSTVAVITEVGEGVNEDGEAIYVLSYYVDGSLKEAVSTVSKTELGVALTPGDIVKVKVGSDGVISHVMTVVDFANDMVRPGYAAPVVTSVAANGAKETFAFGAVDAFKESSTLATIGGNEYKLSQAENVYVIDGTGLNLIIKNGSDASFRYYDALYGDVDNFGNAATDATVVTMKDGDGNVITSGARSALRAYADQVFVREYDGKVKDVVIVKTGDVKFSF